jgi:gamma-glutamylcyclotransferase (GGCT)/AIG2-like uncharacterized protein YtfP
LAFVAFTVFVYGTLLPGQPRWPPLAAYAESWLPAVARGTLWDTGLGYPAAVFSPAGGEIPGVAVRMRPDDYERAIRHLDAVEVEGVLYRRVEIPTSRGPAVTYEWLGETTGFRLLPAGWLTDG